MTAPPPILTPFDVREAARVGEAARMAGVSARTMKRWAALDGIGRLVGSRWMVSRPALGMLLDNAWPVLDAFKAGDRTSPEIVEYLARFGLTGERK